MASRVSIANSALDKLGVSAILSFTEDSAPARKVNLIFDDLLSECLQESAWNFAIIRAEIARLITTPAIGFNYEYQLPIDCLQVLGILRNSSSTSYNYTDPVGELNKDIAFKIEGKKLLCDEESVFISYIKDITDIQELLPLFRSYFTSRLAYELSYGLTGSVSLKDRLEKEYTLKLRTAKVADGSEISPRVVFSSSLVDLRFINGYNARV